MPTLIPAIVGCTMADALYMCHGGHILCVRSGSVSVIQYLMSHVLFVISVCMCAVCRVFRTCV